MKTTEERREITVALEQVFKYVDVFGFGLAHQVIATYQLAPRCCPSGSNIRLDQRIRRYC